jgi:hypothetical protein
VTLPVPLHRVQAPVPAPPQVAHFFGCPKPPHVRHTTCPLPVQPTQVIQPLPLHAGHGVLIINAVPGEIELDCRFWIIPSTQPACLQTVRLCPLHAAQVWMPSP